MERHRQREGARTADVDDTTHPTPSLKKSYLANALRLQQQHQMMPPKMLEGYLSQGGGRPRTNSNAALLSMLRYCGALRRVAGVLGVAPSYRARVRVVVVVERGRETQHG